MSKVHIPATIEEAQSTLEGLGALLTAKEWERAAIVYAFTEERREGRPSKLTTSGEFLSIAEFAALGIAGLKSDTTVRDYRKAWQSAVDDGYARPVVPGQGVDLPKRSYPPNPKQHTSTPTEVMAGVRKLLLDDPEKTIRDMVQGEPEVISALGRGVREHPAVQAIVASEHHDREPREVTFTPHADVDYSADLRHAVNGLLRVLSAMRDGKWQPDEMETTLLTFLRQAFAEITNETETTTYDVINEIEAFLVGQR